MPATTPIADVFLDLAAIAKKEAKGKKEEEEKVVIKQPCCQPGIFTTTTTGRSPVEKCCNPSIKERSDAYNKALQAAKLWARSICRSNPDCPDVEFVKFVTVKDDCQKCELVIEVTIQWHCVKKAKKDEGKGGGKGGSKGKKGEGPIRPPTGTGLSRLSPGL